MASDRLSDQDNGHANKIIYSRIFPSWWALAHRIGRGLLEQIALLSYVPPVLAAPLRGPDDRLRYRRLTDKESCDYNSCEAW